MQNSRRSTGQKEEVATIVIKRSRQSQLLLDIEEYDAAGRPVERVLHPEERP